MTDAQKDKLLDKQAIKHLAILIALAIFIGVYLIVMTAVISRDGEGYIMRAKLMSNDFLGAVKQHYPGLPFIILIFHKLAGLFSDNSSIYTWIYSAQVAVLFCRLLAVVGLYFFGKILMGSRDTFIALLVMLILPYPAFMGSDVVREWPHIMFLTWGILALVYAVRKGVWWFFGVAGLIAGIGHTVRPECIQVVIYGFIWLAVTITNPTAGYDRKRCVLSMLLMLACLSMVVLPYGKVRGRFLPGKISEYIASHQDVEENEVLPAEYLEHSLKAQVPGSHLFQGIGKLFDRICQNLMYFFVLPVAVGLRIRFKKQGPADSIERVIVLGVISLYFVMLMLLYQDDDYISRRHCLPMVFFSIIYLPEGIRTIAKWMCIKIFKRNPEDFVYLKYILLVAGAFICLPKFFAISENKTGYIDAAEWLKDNTPLDANVVTFDGRITLYAERKEFRPSQIKDITGGYYRVELVQGDADISAALATFWLDENHKDKRLVIYRKANKN